MSKLALLGGAPVFDKPLSAPWPPVDEVTAKKLVELYYSREWTAFHSTEKRFAEAFASHHDARFGIFTVNGTVTLESALSIFSIGPGDEVIVPALTWCATAMAVHYVGATPVYVDIDPTTLCIDPDKFEAAITARTRAVIPVHLYGSMADMERVMDIARRHGLRVIEDCAHSHGGIWDGKHVGSIGHVGSFSFQHSKTMACADAGISITSDPDAADHLFRSKQIGYRDGEGSANVQSGPPSGLMCHNYRATAFPALILHEQLKTLDERLDTYGKAALYLEARLKDRTHVRIQARGRKASRQSYFGWVMMLDHPDYLGIPAALFKSAIEAEGMRLTPTWRPVYKFVLYNMPPESYRIPEPCTVTERVGPRVLWMLHAYLGLPMPEIERIGDVLEKVFLNIDSLRSRGDASAGVRA